MTNEIRPGVFLVGNGRIRYDGYIGEQVVVVLDKNDRKVVVTTFFEGTAGKSVSSIPLDSTNFSQFRKEKWFELLVKGCKRLPADLSNELLFSISKGGES
jgi:hypothetical protein